MNTLAEAKAQAQKEIDEENFRVLVEQEKEKIRWPWWRKLWPYRIRIKIINLKGGYVDRRN